MGESAKEIIFCWSSVLQGLAALWVFAKDFYSWRKASRSVRAKRMTIRHPIVLVVLIVGAFGTGMIGLWFVFHPPAIAVVQTTPSQLATPASATVGITKQAENSEPPQKKNISTRPAKAHVQAPSDLNPPASQTSPESPSAPITYEQKCEGSACAQGPGSQATFNQYGAPPIKVTASLDTPQPPPSSTGHPRASVKFYTDRNDDDGQFAVICDRACKAVSLCSLPGFNQGDFGSIPDRPDVAAFVFKRQFPAAYWCVLTVESEDDQPVKILGVKTLTFTNPAPPQ
jgi:hypothetical protein